MIVLRELRWRRYLCIVLALCAIAVSRVSAERGAFVYSDPLIKAVILDTCILVYPDPSEQLTADEVSRIPTSEFISKSDWHESSWTRVAWLRFEIRNAMNTPCSDILSMCPDADTIDLFTKYRGTLTRQLPGGKRLAPEAKYYPSKRSLWPLVLGPHDTVTVFARFILPQRLAALHFYDAALVVERSYIWNLTGSYSIQALFAGVLSLFTLISIFLFFAFKERMFLYYAGFMLFMTIWFAENSGLWATYVFFPETVEFFFSNAWVSIGIVFFFALFIRNYLPVRELFPRTTSVYIAVSFFIAAYAVVHSYFSAYLTRYNALNYMMLAWILFSFFMIIRSAFRKSKSAKVLLVSVAPLTVGATIMQLSNTGIFPVGNIAQTMFQLGVLAFTGTLFYGLLSRISLIQRERAALRAEGEKSDAVLFNVLPEHVAIELKSSGKSPARHLSAVTVLFTDFQEFTAKAEVLSAQELVDELNTLFSEFDRISKRNKIEKIKTIGDAYMAVGGLYSDMEHQAEEVVDSALDMQDAAEAHAIERENAGKPAFRMRVGVHTGPVVAGIVGTTKFQYDVWGSTVNEASRMESSGVVGSVNISEATYLLLKGNPKYAFDPRGRIETKGMGALEMWIVRRASA